MNSAWTAWQPSNNWSNWGDWLPAGCDVAQTQNRTRSRSRSCTGARCGGLTTCEGPASDLQVDTRSRPAEENCCHSENGQWLEWQLANASEWSSWAPAGCGVAQTRSREEVYSRICTPPVCNGTACEGADHYSVEVEHNRTAEENCCRIDGQWSDWTTDGSPWSDWGAFEPAACGVNQTRSRQRLRTRSCSQPSARCGGAECAGSSSELESSVEHRDAADNCCPVAGSWSAWTLSEWSDWTEFLPSGCGSPQTRQRLREKTRACTSPAPACNGTSCAGSDVGTDSQTETRTAEENCCSIDGQWSAWSVGSWSEWSAYTPADQCGVNQTRFHQRTKTRNCSSPPPACGGQGCDGASEDVDEETEERSASENCCAVDGGWSYWRPASWSSWSAFEPSACNVTQQRQRAMQWQRNCTSPTPVCGGQACDGESVLWQTQNGTRSAELNCCPVDGGWSEFAWLEDSAWSSWSAWAPAAAADSCSGEQQNRTRTRWQGRSCNNPPASCGGALCEGPNVQKVTDAEIRVLSGPVGGQWSSWTAAGSWTAWSAFVPAGACSGEQTRQRSRAIGRTCDGTVCGGVSCAGASDDVEVVIDRRTVDGPTAGSWTAWAPATLWSSWSDIATCGEHQTRIRTRNITRSCLPPACGGDDCPANEPTVDIETQVQELEPAATCSINCRVDGGWSAWTSLAWSDWHGLNVTLCNVPQVRKGRTQEMDFVFVFFLMLLLFFFSVLHVVCPTFYSHRNEPAPEHWCGRATRRSPNAAAIRVLAKIS